MARAREEQPGPAAARSIPPARRPAAATQTRCGPGRTETRSAVRAEYRWGAQKQDGARAMRTGAVAWADSAVAAPSDAPACALVSPAATRDAVLSVAATA